MPNNSEKPKSRITIEHRILARNSFFTLLNSYGTFFFSIITSFLLARLITKTSWGFLIIALSWIMIISIGISFLPPGLDDTLNYYLPTYSALKEYNHLKTYIRYAIYLEFIVLIPCFLISFSIFIFFPQVFTFSLREHTNLLVILSPLIIIINIERILLSINKSLSMYNVIFWLTCIRFGFNIGALIFFHFFLNPVNIETIAFMNLIAFLLPFLVNSIIIFIKYSKIHSSDEKIENFKSFIRRILSYGGPVRIGRVISDVWRQLQTQSIAISTSADMVTGFNISVRYTEVSSNVVLTFANPMVITFTRLTAKNKSEEIDKLYNLILIYSLTLLTLITGILFICVDFFLFFVYGESYLTYSLILKLMLFTVIFLGLGTPFEAFALSTKRIKIMLLYRSVAFIIRVPVFLIVIVNYGLLGAILSVIISNFLISILSLVFSTKIFKINIEFKKIILVFCCFFISIGIVQILEFFIFNNLNYFILKEFNLLYFKELNIFSIGLFLLVVIFLNIALKIFTKKDIENIQAIFVKDTRFYSLIQKILNFLKRILRE